MLPYSGGTIIYGGEVLGGWAHLVRIAREWVWFLY